MNENIGHGMTTSKFLRNEEGCNNGHGTLSNAYRCTFHSNKHLCTNATDEKHDQYRLIGTLLRSVLRRVIKIKNLDPQYDTSGDCRYKGPNS